MGIIIVLFLTFMFFSLATAALLSSVFKIHLAVERRIAHYIGPLLTVRPVHRHEGTGFRRLLSVFWNRLKNIADKKMSLEAKSDLERKLREAGYPFNWTPIDFRLTQILLAVLLFMLVFGLFGRWADEPGSLILLAVISVTLGMYYPLFYLSARKKKRVVQIQKEMPDFFDTVNVTIEAGMGLDAAIQQVCQNSKGVLSDEFLKAQEDIRLGKSRREAFTELRNRVPLDAFQGIMTTLIQADQLGIGMANAVRSLTERIREQRIQLAREKAMKAPVKMLFPMILFIFPAIFIVLLGPLIIQLLFQGLFG